MPKPGPWISTEDCMEHSGDWQYWERGKRHCLGCLRDSWREHSPALTKLAADMAFGDGLPSPWREDWPERLRWPEVRRRADVADQTAKGWAIRLRDTADLIDGRRR